MKIDGHLADVGLDLRAFAHELTQISPHRELLTFRA